MMSKRLTLVAQEPIALFEFEVRPVMTVLAHSADEARDLAIECLNRGMCNTYKMQRHISYDAVSLIVEDKMKF